MTIQTATYRNIRFSNLWHVNDALTRTQRASRADTFSNTFRYRAEDGTTACLSPVSQKSLSDLTRKDA